MQYIRDNDITLENSTLTLKQQCVHVLYVFTAEFRREVTLFRSFHYERTAGFSRARMFNRAFIAALRAENIPRDH